MRIQDEFLRERMALKIKTKFPRQPPLQTASNKPVSYHLQPMLKSPPSNSQSSEHPTKSSKNSRPLGFVAVNHDAVTPKMVRRNGGRVHLHGTIVRRRPGLPQHVRSICQQHPCGRVSSGTTRSERRRNRLKRAIDRCTRVVGSLA